MKNMQVLCASLLVLGFSLNSHATRYVVKNPALVPESSQIEKVFYLGADQFYIIEDGVSANSAEFTSLTRLQQLGINLVAEQISEEAEIELVAPSTSTTLASNGWHVKAMKYNDLPTEYDGRGVIVAVIDTGVNYNHPALKPNMWVNKDEIAGNKIDDDKNGYVDDINGYNFVEDNNNPMDGQGHGTHCSGIIAATEHKGTGSRGVAPGAKIMALKLLSSKRSVLTDAVTAIQYAVDNGAKVLSNSWRIYGRWSGSFDINDANIALLKSAIQYARDKGVIYVAAAGNESSDINEIFKDDSIYPIGYTGIDLMVGVASSDSSNQMSDFSNYGMPFVNVAAPGSDIYSTVLGQEWDSYSGTSMATPLVAGVLARGLSRGLSPIDAISNLVETSSHNKSFEKVQAQGIINIVEYLK